jgi:hypothetical protein
MGDKMRSVEEVYACNHGTMMKKSRLKFMPLLNELVKKHGDTRIVASELNCRRFRQDNGFRWCKRSLEKFLLRWNQ